MFWKPDLWKGQGSFLQILCVLSLREGSRRESVFGEYADFGNCSVSGRSFGVYLHITPLYPGWQMSEQLRSMIRLSEHQNLESWTFNFTRKLWECVCVCACVCVHVCVCTQSCLILWDPMDSSLPSSSVHEILQARILERVAIASSRGPSWLRDQIRISCVSSFAGRFFTAWAIKKALYIDI